MKKDNKKKITKTTVKEYGFTDKLIEKITTGTDVSA